MLKESRYKNIPCNATAAHLDTIQAASYCTSYSLQMKMELESASGAGSGLSLIQQVLILPTELNGVILSWAE